MALVVKKEPANAGDIRKMGSIPELGRSPGRGHGNPLQYSCLENPMNRGAWLATVHRLTKSQTRLKWLSMHIRIYNVYLTKTFRWGSNWDELVLRHVIRGQCSPFLSTYSIILAREKCLETVTKEKEVTMIVLDQPSFLSWCWPIALSVKLRYFGERWGNGSFIGCQQCCCHVSIVYHQGCCCCCC